MNSIALLTDGSAIAMAVARWLRESGAEGQIIESSQASWPDAWRHLPRGRFSRVVLLGPPLDDHDSGVDASAAVASASLLIGDLDPIEVRTLGSKRLVEAFRDGSAGLDHLDELQQLLAPSTPAIARTRRGRPRGTDPFRGVGFDVSLTLLLFPDKHWTERSLAEVVGRTPSAVHKSLVELARREYAERRRGSTRLRAGLALRDDLLRSWKSRVIAHRTPAPYISPRRDVEAAVALACKRAKAHALVAGANAIQGPERLLGEPLTYYFDVVPKRVLEPAGFVSASRVGDVIGWEAPEAGVFLFPRRIGKRSVVNRVVAFLDLAAGESERHRAAAEAVWNES